MKTKIKLLIADNNRELTMQMKSFFDGKSDIELIAAASDGLDALEKIKKYSPDAILMDIVLPQLDGIGLLKEINAIGVNINQIAHIANAEQTISKEKIDYLTKLLDEIMNKVCDLR